MDNFVYEGKQGRQTWTSPPALQRLLQASPPVSMPPEFRAALAELRKLCA